MQLCLSVNHNCNFANLTDADYANVIWINNVNKTSIPMFLGHRESHIADPYGVMYRVNYALSSNSKQLNHVKSSTVYSKWLH